MSDEKFYNWPRKEAEHLIVEATQAEVAELMRIERAKAQNPCPRCGHQRIYFFFGTKGDMRASSIHCENCGKNQPATDEDLPFSCE
jgi:DNA-directed RNA polymerase subunit RPC12/RpoP